MSKKRNRENEKKSSSSSNILSVFAVFLLIPLLIGVILPNNFLNLLPNDTLEEDELIENPLVDVEKPKNEGLVVDTTGFEDYQFTVKRSADFRKEDYNISSFVDDGAVVHYELIDKNENSFLEFGSESNLDKINAYASFKDLSSANLSTLTCDGIVISFDVAMDNIKALDRFQLVLRDDSGSPLGSRIPYDKIDIPNIFGTWQQIVLHYNFAVNTCTVYINGEATEYRDVFTGYDSSYSYSIDSFRAMYSYGYKYCRTFIDNFNMKSYTLDYNSEEIINSFETRAGEILDLPIAYVDGVAYYSFEYLQKALAGKQVKDVVIVSPYVYNETETLVISCPVRIKNYGPMKLEFSSDLKCIGEINGVYFYDLIKEE